MPSVRITTPDGSFRLVPIHGAELTVGHAPDNALVLEGGGVSAHHCALVVQGGRVIVVDRGSTNGTFVNNAPVQQSEPLGEHDRVYVGQYLLQVTEGSTAWAGSITAPHLAAAIPPPSRGRRLLSQRGDRSWRDEHARLQRQAEQWERAGRPDHLALRPHELRRARQWLAGGAPEGAEPTTALQRELVEASASASRRMAARRALVLAGGLVALAGLVTAAILVWPEPGDEPEEVATSELATDTTPQAPGEPPPDEPPDEPPPPSDDEPRVAMQTRIDHTVIPEESLDDVARRYGVTVADIAAWNLLNPDQRQLAAGTVVKIERPTKRPLTQQRIRYELEREDTSWNALSRRFGVPATKLRAYNPGVEKLRRGQEISIWIDPHPYAPKQPRPEIPDYVIVKLAESVGHPNAGVLEHGLQLPENEALYIRRYKNIMWGSGYLVANVQTAVAKFRSDMDFDGTLVLADISKKKGGPFKPPHGSHQTGRDIDIWLPTVRGVFKAKYLTAEGDEKFGRRPNPEEVDWFATWGLIRALIETGAVQDIFMTYSIQSKVYDAAKLLGATDEELDLALQYPRSEKSGKGIVMHESGHSHHMHVRFKCAPYEKRCKPNPTRNAPEL
jgi:hypothetical protein